VEWRRDFARELRGGVAGVVVGSGGTETTRRWVFTVVKRDGEVVLSASWTSSYVSIYTEGRGTAATPSASDVGCRGGGRGGDLKVRGAVEAAARTNRLRI